MTSLRIPNASARLTVPVLKPRKCKHCRESFLRRRPIQPYCSPACEAEAAPAIAVKIAAKREREARKAQAEDKRQTRAQLEAMKGVPRLKKEAQEAFNRYIRLRDNGKPCFVTGDILRLGGVGGGFDAGHIRSRSEADHLRFDERNVHGQAKRSNAAGATKPHVMREAAERLLGKETADALYADNRVHKWTRDELREIRDKYRSLARDMRAGEGVA